MVGILVWKIVRLIWYVTFVAPFRNLQVFFRSFRKILSSNVKIGNPTKAWNCWRLSNLSSGCFAWPKIKSEKTDVQYVVLGGCTFKRPLKRHFPVNHFPVIFATCFPYDLAIRSKYLEEQSAFVPWFPCSSRDRLNRLSRLKRSCGVFVVPAKVKEQIIHRNPRIYSMITLVLPALALFEWGFVGPYLCSSGTVFNF